MAGEKTEKPTAKKLQDSRKKGQPTTARSPDVGTWATVLAATLVLPVVVERAVKHSQEAFAAVAVTIETPTIDRVFALLRASADAIVDTTLPLFVTTVAVALLAHAVQGGMRPSAAMLKPQLKRMNPFSGIKRMFGGHAAWEVSKVLIKTALIGAVVWNSVSDVLPLLTAAGRLPLSVTVSAGWDTTLSLLRNAAAAGLVLSLADYAMVRKRTMKGLKMSKQDIKDEYKQSEGDPAVKAHIRSRQMSMSRNRMMNDVVHADVIVINPVHIAVALKYDPKKGAPRVLAKGAGVIARRIREEAEKHSVPMIENVPLARGLYKACDIGQEIPAEMYTAVAQVLAFVLALKARGAAASGIHRPPNLATSLHR